MRELPHPPRAAVRFLRRLTAKTEHIEAALSELFRRRAVRDGLTSARLWYWREVLALIGNGGSGPGDYL